MVFYNFPLGLVEIRLGICGIPNQNTISQALSLHEMQSISLNLDLRERSEMGNAAAPKQIPSHALC